MRRYAILAGLLLASFLFLFLLIEALEIPLLTDPVWGMERAGVLAALIGTALLVVDVALPVPSSLVMIAHGAFFGVMIGTLLSMIGSVGAVLVGFAIGRRGGVLLARLVPPEERARADRLLERWGALAILITRPVPLLAETITILAGASPLGWMRALLAALAGSFPAALLYAITGATTVSFANGALMFGALLLMAAVFWGAGRWAESRIVRSMGEVS